MSQDFISRFVNLYKDKAPEELLGWSAISIIAAALENKVYVRAGKGLTFPNMYVILVGDSGVGKTLSSSKAIQIAKGVPSISFLPTVVTGPSLVEALFQVGHDKKILLGNNTYPSCAGYLYASEAKGFLQKKYNEDNIISLITDLWDNPPSWSKHTLSRGSVELSYPNINILAGTTASWLRSSVTKSDLEGGFAARCLFINSKAEPKPDLLTSEEDHSAGSYPAEFVERVKLIDSLKAISKLSGRFTLKKDFIESYNKLSLAHPELYKSKKDSLLAGYWQRRMYHLMKLCQIVSVSESLDLVLEQSHFERALEILEGTELSLGDVFSSLGDNTYGPEMVKVWDYICKKESDETRLIELATIFHADISRKKLNEIIDHLITMKKLVIFQLHARTFYVRVDRDPLSFVNFSTAESRGHEVLSRKKKEYRDQGLS